MDETTAEIMRLAARILVLVGEKESPPPSPAPERRAAAPLAASAPPPPSPRPPGQYFDTPGVPDEIQAAQAWQPGDWEEYADPTPLSDEQRAWLVSLARSRGTKGLCWLAAIERATTEGDALGLKTYLKGLPYVPEKPAAAPVAKNGAGSNGR